MKRKLLNQTVKKNYLIRSFFFLFILLILWQGIEKTLEKPRNGDWQNNDFSNVYKKNCQFDTILLGTSMVIANISNEELYSNYGFTTVSFGEPEQPLYLSYYMLEEALKYQQPKVVILDVQSMFYSLEKIKRNLNDKEYYYLHYSLDQMKNGDTKFKALDAARELKPSINIFDYFFPMYYSHANWEDINRENFSSSEETVQNGDMLLTNIYQYKENELQDITKVSENYEQRELIPQSNLNYFNKIVGLCKNKDIDLLLVRSSFSGESRWSWGQYNAINDLAEDNNLAYIDVNTEMKKVGLDVLLDMGDSVHFNVAGMKKWTDYIGKYISKKYNTNGIKDKKNINSYQRKENFDDKLKCVQEKKSFLQCRTFDEYLVTLLNYKKDGYAIGIVVSDDASSKMTEYECSMLQKLGLKIRLLDQYRSSYVGLIEDGNVIEEALAQNGIEKEGNFNNLDSYKLSSGGYDSNINASIKINSIEFCQGKRGINIVVYDKKNKEAISSVFFDTYLSENPHPGIVKADAIYEMIDVNEWKAIVAD